MKSNGNGAGSSPVVATVYFSPTGTTERITESIAVGMGQNTPLKRSITIPEDRAGFADWVSNNLLDIDYWVFGVPVHGGHVPPVAYETLAQMQVKERPALACVV